MMKRLGIAFVVGSLIVGGFSVVPVMVHSRAYGDEGDELIPPAGDVHTADGGGATRMPPIGDEQAGSWE